MVRGTGVCDEVILRAAGQYEWEAASSPGETLGQRMNALRLTRLWPPTVTLLLST
jgi:hypothetical protein